MRRTWPVLLPAIVLALLGAWASYLLMAKHLTKTSGAGWFDSVCEGGTESAVSCDEVLGSRYGMFPPVPEDAEPADKYKPQLVIGSLALRPRPVALFGLTYFIALAGWYIGIGRPSYSRRLLHLVPLLLSVCGACGSAFFAYVMFFTNLQAWCPWCMVTHLINWLLLACAILLWPRSPGRGPDGRGRYCAFCGTWNSGPPVQRGQAEGRQCSQCGVWVPLLAAARGIPGQSLDDADGTAVAMDAVEIGSGERMELSLADSAVLVVGEASNGVRAEVPASPPAPAPPAPAVAPPVPAPHPSFILLVMTLAAVVAAMAAEWYFHDYAALAGRYVALDRAMEQVRSHAATLYAMYESGQKHTIPVRDDDPIRNDGTPRLALVIFTDFECPHCARLPEYLDRHIFPIFDGYLKVVFKYFPANKACNPRVKNAHPHAYRAASAAEAARTLAGHDAFWEAHDVLFASGRKLADFDYRGLARQLDLDPDEFLETMDSEAVQDRIKEDIELALEVGVNATPALYLSGRRVPRIAVRSPVFWQAAKGRLDRILKARQAKDRQQQQPQDPPQPQPNDSPPAAGGR